MGRKKQRENYEAVTDLVSIWQRGRTWYAYFIEGGKTRRPSLQTRYVEQARRKAMEIDEKLRMGLSLISADMEVGELFERYLQRCRTDDLSPNTINRYDPVFRRFTAFCKEMGVLKAGRVSLVLVEDYAASRAQEGIADTTRYREMQWVKQVWKYAEERRLIPVNLIRDMKLRKPAEREQPCFTASQVGMILAQALGQLRDIIIMLAYTGMRRAELRWLAWRDVDLENGWIHIRAKHGWRVKNRKDRKVPIYPPVRRVLERLPRKHRWVFTARRSKRYPDGEHQINVEHVRERLLKIMAKLGIEKGGLHSFRRFFISYCANHGVPPTVVMKWVGHSDLRMILTYYNLQDKESQEAMQTLAERCGLTQATGSHPLGRM